MPVLADPKHEKFAQLLFEGVDDGNAYVQAGYKKNPGNASRLKNNEKIQGRVIELLEKAADVSIYNKEWVLRELADTYKVAKDCGQHSAAVGALKLIGTEGGMFETKSQVTVNTTENKAEQLSAARNRAKNAMNGHYKH